MFSKVSHYEYNDFDRKPQYMWTTHHCKSYCILPYKVEFDIRAIAHSLHTLDPTKRNIVGFSSRFYDPLDYLSPVIITLKVFFKDLCKSKLKWDENLPTELLHNWKSLVSRYSNICCQMLFSNKYFTWLYIVWVLWCFCYQPMLLWFICTMD